MSPAEPETACIDEALQEIFHETDLLAFQSKLVFEKQLTRLEHFYDVTDVELKTYGLSEPAIRRLRAAIERRRKKRAKLFGNGKRSVRLVQVQRPQMPVERQGFEFNCTQPFLIPKNEVKLMETLGEGNFSVVKRALWTRPDGSKTDCAVKILHEMSEPMRQDLAAEISTMQRLRHQNLVQLFGVVFGDASTLMVIEYCEGGSLLDRLRDGTKPRPLVTTLLNYAQQISTGMSYLETRRCVHRDLAARNVLLTHDEQIIKICDFGLTRALSENERLYIMQEPKKVPFSWCPPESLRYRQFSHKSDVWAFGVTMWELYTYGEEPWIGYRAAEVLQFIESGERLRKPEYCPQELYEIMRMCWNNEAEERPKFSHLRKLLMDIKFMHIICRSQNVSIVDGQLYMLPGDELLLIGERENRDQWFGQSITSRKFGEFPRASVSMKTAAMATPEMLQQQQQSPGGQLKNGLTTTTLVDNSRISVSVPVAGSFIHTGHGDIDERRCWGHVDHIDDIYLKNPIINAKIMEQTAQQQKVTIIPSLLDAQKTTTSTSGTSGPPASAQHSSPQTTPTAPSAPLPLPMPVQFPISPLSMYSPIDTLPNLFNITSSPMDVQKRQQMPSSNSATSSSSSSNRSSAVPSLGSRNSQQPQFKLTGDAFDEWISTTTDLGQLGQKNAIQNGQNSTGNEQKTTTITNPVQHHPLTPLNPPPSQLQLQPMMNGGRLQQNGTSSKYDSSISIPRPNRTSPVNSLTPPPVTAENFIAPSNNIKSSSLGPSTSTATVAELKKMSNNMAAFSSLPSSTAALNVLAAAVPNGEGNAVPLLQLQERFLPKSASTHSIMFDRGNGSHQSVPPTPVQQNNADDPFWVKDDVRTLTAKLPYKEVHKATDFLYPMNAASTSTIAQTSSTSTIPNRQTQFENQQQQQKQPSNVAVVYPFMNGQQKQQQMAQQQHQQQNDTKSENKSINPYDKIGSLLPPPSELLLSGFGTAKTSTAPYQTPADNLGGQQPQQNGFIASLHHQYQPIFDISGNSAQHLNLNPIVHSSSQLANNNPNGPRIRYGSNGIPILEPIPMQTLISPAKVGHPIRGEESTQKSSKGQLITLNELDTDALVNRVKKSVDFVSREQCRMHLLRTGFDVERTIRELKIEKLIEMGLATDRELAASALDSEQWDVNAAANRLCCS